MPDGFDAPHSSTAQEVLAGLNQRQKTLPAKFFYDAEGCRLFGEITRLPEYYVTRAEQALISDILPELPCLPGCVLVEYGASDEGKALAVIDRLGASSYVPIDIAAEALEMVTARLAKSRRHLDVYPVVADFQRPLRLPAECAQQTKFGFFPGSTIGNLEPAAARRFLAQARETLGPNAYFLVGVDLRKDPAVLIPAYDDAQGVTAAFNRNVLAHLNRVLGSDFDTDSFAHRAIWNASEGRIEMHLVSSCRQTVDVAGCSIDFSAGETIHTENSYKHTVEQFQALAFRAGWFSSATWTDEANLFSLHLLSTKA